MTMTYPFPVSGDEFKGKRVLVTGGTKGMGEAMVRRFTLRVCHEISNSSFGKGRRPGKDCVIPISVE
jgi:FlaA1/EpsC-like NDP-sugar epimerase